MSDRAAMDAIFFRLRTGCQWNALNATGLCSSSSAHRRFQEWTAAVVFLELWRRGVTAYDEIQGIDWSWLAADGAMTKAPLGEKNTGPNPTDRGKRGTKRSLLTDGRGVPLALTVAGANRNDFKRLRQTLAALVVRRPRPTRERPQGLCLDKGDDDREVYALLRELKFTPHVRPRGEEARAKRTRGSRARRWGVERTHSWINRFRALLVRWDKKDTNYRAALHLACAYTAFRASGLQG